MAACSCSLRERYRILVKPKCKLRLYENVEDREDTYLLLACREFLTEGTYDAELVEGCWLIVKDEFGDIIGGVPVRRALGLLSFEHPWEKEWVDLERFENGRFEPVEDLEGL